MREESMELRVNLIVLLLTYFAEFTRTTVPAIARLQRSDANREYEYEFEDGRKISQRNRSSGEDDEFTGQRMQKNVARALLGRMAFPLYSMSAGQGSIMSEETRRYSQRFANVRINSKRPSSILELLVSPSGKFTSDDREVLSRKKTSKIAQAIIPLLMAYKLKFTAIIPMMLGGLAALVSTTALAGFFFALFAAVLGLKAH